MRASRWAPEDDLKLIVLSARGVPKDRIARLLGRGFRISVRERLQRLRNKLGEEESAQLEELPQGCNVTRSCSIAASHILSRKYPNSPETGAGASS